MKIDQTRRLFYPPETIPFYPPDINLFLKDELWAINEAVYAVAGWPTENLAYTCLSPIHTGKAHRSFFYLPEHNSVFDPVQLSKVHLEIYSELKKSIEKGAIWVRYENIHEGIFYLLRPMDVILWALLKGYTLPKDLQRALNAFQMDETMDETKQIIAMQKKVMLKVTGQYLLSMNPELDVSNLCKDPLIVWAQTYGLHNESDDATAYWKRCVQKAQIINSYVKEGKRIPTKVRSCIDELFETKGIPGRRPSSEEEKPKRLYIPKPIPEVMREGENGIVYYHFPLLNIAIETLINAKKDEIYPSFFNGEAEFDNLESFSEQIRNDSVIQLYLNTAPSVVQMLLEQIIDRVWGELRSVIFQMRLSEKFDQGEIG